MGDFDGGSHRSVFFLHSGRQATGFSDGGLPMISSNEIVFCVLENVGQAKNGDIRAFWRLMYSNLYGYFFYHGKAVIDHSFGNGKHTIYTDGDDPGDGS